MRLTGRVIVFGLVLSAAATLVAQNRIQPDEPRTIEAGTSLWAEELTFMDVREAVKSGTTTIIIGTGGVEQNGPYIAGGKHNFVLTTVLPYIARSVGHALIAPIVKFVPEGSIEPKPTGHMAYAGTISLEDSTFEALLTDICRSYKAHGFIDIILVGDSGGNQRGMENVANALNKKWAAEQARVHYLREYYYEDQWSYDYLKTLGITQIDGTPPPASRRIAAATGATAYTTTCTTRRRRRWDPTLIRLDQRIKAGQFSRCTASTWRR